MAHMSLAYWVQGLRLSISGLKLYTIYFQAYEYWGLTEM